MFIFRFTLKHGVVDQRLVVLIKYAKLKISAFYQTAVTGKTFIAS